MKFELKRVSGKSILFVMAAEAEYGPFLRSRIDPLMTGVGPVEAAIALTRAFAQLEAQGDLPDLVVSLGSAGSSSGCSGNVWKLCLSRRTPTRTLGASSSA